METEHAILGLAALAQPTRLDAFRLLVRHEPNGMAAGDIADTLAVPANTMSAHLGVLSRAGLITSKRVSRSIIYRVDLGRISNLVLFLLKDCCEGRADLCQPLLAQLAPCCD
jgi:DNA-binding transcriptional ArsR family regulator